MSLWLVLAPKSPATAPAPALDCAGGSSGVSGILGEELEISD
jgi:hypothetical protein